MPMKASLIQYFYRETLELYSWKLFSFLQINFSQAVKLLRDTFDHVRRDGGTAIEKQSLQLGGNMRERREATRGHTETSSEVETGQPR